MTWRRGESIIPHGFDNLGCGRVAGRLLGEWRGNNNVGSKYSDGRLCWMKQETRERGEKWGGLTATLTWARFNIKTRMSLGQGFGLGRFGWGFGFGLK